VLLAELVVHQHKNLLLPNVRDLDRRGDANCRKHDGRDRQKHEHSEGRERGHGGDPGECILTIKQCCKNKFQFFSRLINIKII